MPVGTAQLISTTEMISITDAAGKAYEVMNPYLGDGTGTNTGGYWGQQALGRVVGLPGTYYGLSDKYKHESVSAGAQSFADTLLSDAFWPAACGNLINGLNDNISRYGRYLSATILDLDSYASYHNGEHAHTMTYCSAFARLYYLWRAKAAMLSASNVLADSTILASGTVVATGSMTLTNVTSINTVSTVAAGVQGYAADNIELVVTSGTLTGTVTVTALDQNGTAAYWQAIVNGLTSAGTAHAFTQSSGKRTASITDCNYSGDGTAASWNMRTVGRNIAA